MTDYGRIKSTVRPEPVETTETMVYVATDITPFLDSSDNQVIEGYEYNYVGYTKDEYIQHVTQSNTESIDMLLGCVLEMSEIIYQ